EGRKARGREREGERGGTESKRKKVPLGEPRPWQDLGISRSPWYRRNPRRRRETKPRGQQVPLSTNMQASQFVSLAQAEKKEAIRAASDHPEACFSLKSPTVEGRLVDAMTTGAACPSSSLQPRTVQHVCGA